MWILGFQPPWLDIDGVCIAPPDPNWTFKFSVSGIHVSNEECADWLLAVAGSGIRRLEENKFEMTEVLPAKTIGEWIDWEVGKEPWQLISHASLLTLHYDDFINVHLDAMASRAKQELAELCAHALARI
jgi:hypothetical protein